MPNRRPLSITILAVLVGLGALVALIHSIQFFYILPTVSRTPVNMFAYDLMVAIDWGINAAILIWMTISLWNMGLDSRRPIIIVAVLDIILAVVTAIGLSSIKILAPAILINAILLIYCLLPFVGKAFQQIRQAASAATEEKTMAEEKTISDLSDLPAGVAPAVIAAGITISEPEIASETALAVAAEETIAESSEESLLLVSDETPSSPVVPLEGEAVLSSIPTHANHPKVAIETIEGIGPVYGTKLKAVGIRYVADILEAGASRKGREILVEKTGISPALILKWVNMADLMRISGIGEEFSELLEMSGVDTVKELRNRNPDHLHQAMLQANQARKIVRRTPYLSEVQSWISQAKQLDPVITY